MGDGRWGRNTEQTAQKQVAGHAPRHDVHLAEHRATNLPLWVGRETDLGHITQLQRRTRNRMRVILSYVRHQRLQIEHRAVRCHHGHIPVHRIDRLEREGAVVEGETRTARTSLPVDPVYATRVVFVSNRPT